jgi:5'-3' exoribonuclease 2
MNEIRKRGCTCPEHPIVYGLDADLIFLSMLNNPRIVLVRENVFFDKKEEVKDRSEVYTYLDIQELTKILVKILDWNTGLPALGKLGVKNSVADGTLVPPKKQVSNPIRLIQDYTFMCFLLGNDFLPHLPSLRIRDDSLADLIVFYKITAWTSESPYLLNEDSTLNYAFFTEFMAELAHVENELLAQQGETRRKSIRRFQEKIKNLNPYEREKENYTYVEDKYEDTINPGQPGWRIRYYKEHMNLLFKTDVLFQADVHQICKNYLEGCQWVIQYYLGKSTNWDYQYNYKVAPSASDLANLLENGYNQVFQWDISEPVSPYVQLMSILPPDSHALLPRNLQGLLTEKDSDIHYLYPIEFRISMNGNRFLHECPPILPYVDRALLRRIIAVKEVDFTPEEKYRNSPGQPIVFSF